MNQPTEIVQPLHFTLGSVSIWILHDGTFRLDGGAAFGRIPKVMWEKVMPPDHLNRVPMDLNSILIESHGQHILIETGYGDKMDAKQREMVHLERPNGSLIDQLAIIGRQPEDIDIVINTHLHADHCGWNTYRVSPDNLPVPTFPHARYCVQRLEWDEANHPNELTRAAYPNMNFLPLEEAGVLDLLDGDVQLTPEVRIVTTPGHTAGHQSIWLTAGGASVLFSGDIALYGLMLERINWVGAVDNLPLVTVETRRRLVEEIISRQAHVVVTHQPFPGLGTLERVEGQHRPIFRIQTTVVAKPLE